MKILIISDTHLTHRFDQKKFDYLTNLIKKADKVILNGDFWDFYFTSFDTFIKSEWKDLFSLLKSKDAHYIFGNHDEKEYSDGRIYEFCNKSSEVIEINSGKKVFRVEHGHHLAPSLDLIFPQMFRNGPMLILAHLFDRMFYKIFGKLYFRFVFRGMNETMRKWKIRNMDKKHYLVCGHSHHQEFVEPERFINLGLVRYGLAQGLFIENGKVEFIDEKY